MAIRSLLLALMCFLAWLPTRLHTSEYFLVILVDAPHLNYQTNAGLLRSIAKHPNGCKDGTVGHAWIYLQGVLDGKLVYIEGGHSGELGLSQPKYFDGIMNYLYYGYAAPTSEQKKHPRIEPNPIKYLWTTQKDGFFQKGPGRHKPTYAAKKDITEAQFRTIYKFLETYPYSNYSLSGMQCSTLAAQAAALAGLSVESEITIHIEPVVRYGGQKMQLWQDPCYSYFTFSSPDILECSLKEAVRQGRAVDALRWYYFHRP